MSDNLLNSGFKFQIGGSIGFNNQWTRRPTAVNSFDEVLPTDIPIPFKQADEQGETQELTLFDGAVLQYADITGLEQEHIISASDAACLNVADTAAAVQEHELQPADSYVSSAADSAELNQEHNLTVSDSANSNIAETINVAQEQELQAADSFVIGAVDAAELEQEHNLNASDSANVLSSDTVGVEQEHVVSPSDAFASNVADTVTLGFIGDSVLAVEDGVNRNESDLVGLTVVSAPVVVKRGGRRLPIYFFPQPEPQKEKKPEIFVLRVQDGFVGNTADTAAVYEVIDLRVLDGKAKAANGGVVDIRCYRSKRKIQDDEILLMAA